MSLYVAVFNGQEVNFGIKDGDDKEPMIRRLVADSGITTTRKNPQKVQVDLYRTEAEKGKLVRKPHGKFSVMPPSAPMTNEEYQEEVEAMLSKIPAEFWLPLKNAAWDEYHQSDYENVLSRLGELIGYFAEAITKYTNRLKKA